MTYDAENRMTSAQYTDSGSVLHLTEYFYSGDSLLAKQKKYDNGILVSEINFVRAGFLPVQERDSGNTVTREYTWGLNLGGGIGGLLNLRQNSNDYSYLYDGKGNVSTLINSAQSVVANYRYDPAGVLMKKTATIDQQYMFSTKQYDEKLGFLTYEYRILMPEPGKWTTRDPLGEYGGINIYQMTGNNPVNWIDLWGLDSFEFGNGMIFYINDNGFPVYSWPAVSGPWDNGPLPPGTYIPIGIPVTVPPTHPNQSSYCDPSGNCWWQPISPDNFSIYRTGLGMHPDGNVPGTSGCIGATDRDTSNLRNFLMSHPGLPLRVW